jgi:hypothetical protein
MHVTAVLIGNTAACVAAVAAAIGLYFARVTVREAKLARLDSEAARKDAVAERREAERDRLRHRVERIGELVDDFEGSFYLGATGRGYAALLNLLRQALVGLMDELPCCAAIANAGNIDLARDGVPAARDEVEAALRDLRKEDLAAQTQAAPLDVPARR